MIEIMPSRSNSSARGRLFASTPSASSAPLGRSSPGRGWFRPAPSPLPLTQLTVLTMSWDWFSPMAVILIVRVPNRPSRPKAISIPSARSGRLCPTQPASECPRGLFWPASTVDAKDRMRGHDRADNGRHGIVVDDILYRGAPVAFEAGRRHVPSIGMGGHQAGSH